MAGRRPRDDRLRIHLEHELAGAAAGQQVRVFRRFLARHLRRAHQFQPPQPLDVRVAFETWHDQPYRITVLGAQPFTVLRIDDERALEDPVERQAARHCRAVGAFGEQPACVRIDAGFVEQRREPNTCPFAARQQPVRELNGQPARAVPFAAGVARAFEEVDPRLGRKAQQVVDREHARLAHEAVHDDAMTLRIDLRHARMMTLVDEAVRRDVAEQVGERRHRRAGAMPACGRCGGSHRVRAAPARRRVATVAAHPVRGSMAARRAGSAESGASGWLASAPPAAASLPPISRRAGAVLHAGRCAVGGRNGSRSWSNAYRAPGQHAGNAHSRQPNAVRQTTIPALLIAPRCTTLHRARYTRRQNFTRSPVTNATGGSSTTRCRCSRSPRSCDSRPTLPCSRRRPRAGRCRTGRYRCVSTAHSRTRA